MQSNYPHFETTTTLDEKFDPSFSRHPDENQVEFDENPGNDEIRNAAVAAARLGEVQLQQQQAQQQVQQVQQQQQQQQQAQQAQQQQVQQQQHLLQLQHSYQLQPPVSPQDKDSDRPFHRPVSTTKRAKQNRNAQRAFRQRKEKYIKELEAKATETDHLKQTIEELRAENLQLRDYTLALQSRVIELSPPNQIAPQGDGVPPPPAAIFKRD